MLQGVKIYPIGIDIDASCLTAAQFRKTRRGIQLRRLFYQPLPATTLEDDALLTHALKSVVASGFFKGSRVAVNLPFRDLSVFPVHFQLVGEEDPEEAIVREALKFLPYPAEEAIIDYPSLMMKSGTCDVTVVAVRRRVMARWLAILQSAGLTAEVMEFNVSSLVRLHRTLFPGDGQSDLLCHIGRTQTLLSVATGEGILCLAEISWGLQSLWNKIETQLELSDAAGSAINLLKTYGLAYREGEAVPPCAGEENTPDARDMCRVIFQIIAPAVDELVYEVHKTIGYLRSLQNDAVLGKVYLYGLAGLIYHLDRYLEKYIGLPAQNVDVLANMMHISGHGPSDIPEGVSPVPALGLAMRELPWL